MNEPKYYMIWASMISGAFKRPWRIPLDFIIRRKIITANMLLIGPANLYSDYWGDDILFNNGENKK